MIKKSLIYIACFWLINQNAFSEESCFDPGSCTAWDSMKTPTEGCRVEEYNVTDAEKKLAILLNSGNGFVRAGDLASIKSTVTSSEYYLYQKQFTLKILVERPGTITDFGIIPNDPIVKSVTMKGYVVVSPEAQSILVSEDGGKTYRLYGSGPATMTAQVLASALEGKMFPPDGTQALDLVVGMTPFLGSVDSIAQGKFVEGGAGLVGDLSMLCGLGAVGKFRKVVCLCMTCAANAPRITAPIFCSDNRDWSDFGQAALGTLDIVLSMRGIHLRDIQRTAQICKLKTTAACGKLKNQCLPGKTGTVKPGEVGPQIAAIENTGVKVCGKAVKEVPDEAALANLSDRLSFWNSDAGSIERGALRSAGGEATQPLVEMAYTVIPDSTLNDVLINGLKTKSQLTGETGVNPAFVWFKKGFPFYGEGTVLGIPAEKLRGLGGFDGIGLAEQKDVIRLPQSAIPCGLSFDEITEIGVSRADNLRPEIIWKR